MSSRLIKAMLVMAGVTYLLRAMPVVILRRKIKNIRLRSFLFYVPYAVLAAMTFPAILSSTRSAVSALCGLGAALVLGWQGKSLMMVAAAACAAVFLAELLV